ncbi:hypothetical protein TKK_0018921 [Trichogramma kaykai]|uniref:Peptidase S1 domain-containing protein n=1 Tax=Trichogramma kaykai TaxID=54128 RepID=A0ABD2VVK2_9HYME
MISKVLSLFVVVVLACLASAAEETENKKNVGDRVVGGEYVDIVDYPYQVSLRKYGEHYCGGSIISKRHILTAAHCISGLAQYPYNDITVFTGTSQSYGYSGQSHRVVNTWVHPYFRGDQDSAFAYDIGIMMLADEIQFNAYQQPIQLPTRDVRYGEIATTTGWGIQHYPSNDVSPILKRAYMATLPASECNSALPEVRNIQVCALNKYGVGVCSGDSGGPLVVDGQVFGITSWVVPCARGVPDVYTKVYSFVDWIRNVVNQY